MLRGREAGEEAFVETILEKALADSLLSPADRRLAHELVCGVVRWQATLDWLIARQAARPLQKPKLQILLRLGLYQIFWLDRIPSHAAVNETVEMAKRGGMAAQAGFVNAMLRNYLREFDATRQRLTELKTTHPGLGFSHPEWVVTRWQRRWGAEKTAELMEWNNTPPAVYARVNTLKTGSKALLAQWREEGVECSAVRRDWLEENAVFELSAHPPLHTLPSFQRGWFYLQDPGTLLAVRELNPQPGETVLDFCAAPGGKATYIAQLMQNQGRLIAQDTDARRMKLLEENSTRLGVAIAQPVLPASLDVPPVSLDRILVDAPCSNTGVLRRRAEVRWRIRPQEIERLQTLQGKVLRRAAALLKPGGTLVYSTCSLEPEENQDVIRRFLLDHPDFTAALERELLPFRDKVDGAFVTRLTRS